MDSPQKVSRRSRLLRTLPGLGFALLLAAAATALGTAVPVFGAPVCGILLGVLAGVLLRRWCYPFHAAAGSGARVASTYLLQAGIVILGVGLPFTSLVDIGAAIAPIMLATFAVTLSGALLLGRLMKLDPELRILIGAGTAICGASAIAAIAAVLHPAKDRIAIALGTVLTFSVTGALIFPVLGSLAGLSDEMFGIWAGTAINDTSTVVAAAYAFGAAAGTYAVVVKLARSLLIVPLCLAVQAWVAVRSHRRGTPVKGVLRSVPIFVFLFVGATFLPAAGILPAAAQEGAGLASTFLVTAALAAIGVLLRPAQLTAAGVRPLAFGGLLGILAGGVSLALLTFWPALTVPG
ncbi:YeiH family protein [Hoyosella subflava]|nr:putative sulfate exporter family transporter [Hoyosella subflava]